MCDNILAYGLLSVDFDISSKSSKLLQKMIIFGNLETKVYLIDQIMYIIRELMIEQSEDYHLQMFLQLLVSCIKLWHHTEIHKLRLTTGPLTDQLNGVQFYNINSPSKSQKIKRQPDSENQGAKGAGKAQTYPDIQNYLYIFDLIDSISLIGICNKDKRARNLSLVLIQESSKLKRLIAGHDTRKTLADLLYLNELAIKDKLVERLTLLKMFKFKNFKTENQSQYESFTKTYNLEDIGQIL